VRNKFLIGSDVESFAFDAEGHPVSAIPLVKGTKHKPINMNGVMVSHDNVAVEWAIPPAGSRDEFVASMLASRTAVIERFLSPVKLVLGTRACQDFPASQLASAEAKRSGCDPDFDAWRIVMNAPAPLRFTRLRSAGAHLHLSDVAGYPFLTDGMGRLDFVRIADAVLMAPAVTLEDATAVNRRRLYGNAGCHRPKPYGVELRTLSPWWTDNKSNIEWVYDRARLALEITRVDPKRFWKELANNGVDGEAVVQTIDTCNHQLSDRIEKCIRAVAMNIGKGKGKWDIEL